MKKIILSLIFILIIGMSFCSCKYNGSGYYHTAFMGDEDNISSYLYDNGYECVGSSEIGNSVSLFFEHEDTLKPKVHVHISEGKISVTETYNDTTKYKEIVDSLTTLYKDTTTISDVIYFNKMRYSIRKIKERSYYDETYTVNEFEVEYHNWGN